MCVCLCARDSAGNCACNLRYSLLATVRYTICDREWCACVCAHAAFAVYVINRARQVGNDHDDDDDDVDALARLGALNTHARIAKISVLGATNMPHTHTHTHS